MKRAIAVVLAVMMMLAFALTAAGCEPMLDSYESDTFELGESSR